MAANLLDRLDRGWTKLELGLALFAAGALVVSLIGWVALKGLSSKTTDTFIAGLVFRAAASAVIGGSIAVRLSRRPTLGWLAAVLAAASAWLWRNVGVDAFNNVFAWLQDGSLLTWLGGLRGIGTRLTLWLALLGASLATATGRHVTIDVITRALGDTWRRPLASFGGVVAAAVCAVSAYGFFDFIAVDAFGAAPTTAFGDKAVAVSQGLQRHAARAVIQATIDLHVAARVVGGTRWDQAVTGKEWNAWLGGSAELASQRETDETARRSPLLSLPQEASRGLLVKDFGLIIPFGLLMMALRFVLWVLRGAPAESPHGGAP